MNDTQIDRLIDLLACDPQMRAHALDLLPAEDRDRVLAQEAILFPADPARDEAARQVFLRRTAPKPSLLHYLRTTGLRLLRASSAALADFAMLPAEAETLLLQYQHRLRLAPATLSAGKPKPTPKPLFVHHDDGKHSGTAQLEVGEPLGRGGPIPLQIWLPAAVETECAGLREAQGILILDLSGHIKGSDMFFVEFAERTPDGRLRYTAKVTGSVLQRGPVRQQGLPPAAIKEVHLFASAL